MSEFRFVVKNSEGCFSCSWKAWRKGNSIYIAPRKLGGIAKISLHPDGGYRYAFTKESKTKLSALFATGKRDFVVWSKPDKAANGPAKILSICFPTEFLKSARPTCSTKNGIIELNCTIQKGAKFIDFGYFGDTKKAKLFFQESSEPLVHWELEDGTSIYVLEYDSEYIPPIVQTSNLKTPPLCVTYEAESQNSYVGNDLIALCHRMTEQGNFLQLVELGGQALG